MSPNRIPLPTRRSTIRLARALAPLLRPGDLVILSGGLGAGKTFFVRGLSRALGLPHTEPVTSPTFALIQELDTHPPVVHADLYRLSSSSDVARLGLDAQRHEGNVLVVEWGEPYIPTLGEDALIISLTLNPRQAELSATGARSSELLANLSRAVHQEQT